jgi:hypothetical protein
MFEDGFELIVDQKYRWHDSHKNQENLTDKLKT